MMLTIPPQSQREWSVAAAGLQNPNFVRVVDQVMATGTGKTAAQALSA